MTRADHSRDESPIGLSENTPLRLADAVAIAYSDGSITEAHLKAEVKAHRLMHERVAGKVFVTLGYLAEWRGSFEARRALDRIYICGFDDYVKIGFSRNVTARIKSMQTAVPVKLAIHYTGPGSAFDEAALHLKFAEHRLNGEWFVFADDIKAWIAARSEHE